MLNRLSRFASNLMICLLATVMLLGIGCLAGLTQEVNAATKVVRVDRKTEMDGKEFKNWVESSNRVHEGIHNVELINNWDVSSQQDDGMMVYASMNFYFNDYYIKGNNDDTLFWISDNVEINMYGNGPDSKIFNCGDYYEDGIWERTIWDIAPPAALSVPEAFTISEITAPVFGDNQRYAFDATRHKILYMEKLNPEVVFADTFACISKLG